MIAIDTNVLLRYLTKDDEAQAAQAKRIFELNESILITDVVLAETLWSLDGPVYKLAKPELIAVVQRLIDDKKIRFEDDEVVWRALFSFIQYDADFADALIVHKASKVASEADGLQAVFTFDKAALQLPYTAKP